jgi:glycosyltransferase involved in cell wall biosynthesis
MGRMDNSKGFDLLLHAFAECARKHPDWTLRIIGEGPDRAQLRMLVHRLDLESLVRLDTIVADPASAFMSADLFVLSSRFEGFPNVLLEAMACGLPVISFDCPSGPGEIIRDGVDGILVPPNDRLMGAENERKRLAACAIQVTERFSLSKVVGMWREVLDAALRQPRGTIMENRH